MADQYYINQAVNDLKNVGLFCGVMVPDLKGLTNIQTDMPDGNQTDSYFCGAVLDSRSVQTDQLFVALAGENVDGRQFIPQVLQQGNWVLSEAPTENMLAAWNTNNYPANCGVLLSSDPVAALNCLAASWRQKFELSVVGITGTNGKTTTKDMLAALLSGGGQVHATSGNFNNNLGLPITVLGLRSEHRYAVIEMGASAVGEIAALAPIAAPQVGVITNAAPAHLAEFGSLDGIILGKGELLDSLPANGVAILNSDSVGFNRWAARSRCKTISFGTKNAEFIWSWLPCGSKLERPVNGPTLLLDGDAWPVPLPGKHNAANLAAAILAARAVGLTNQQMYTGLAGYSGSAHRGIVLDIAGRTVIDDCYNANPRSMLAAGQMLLDLSGSGQAIAVLGHMAELGDDSASIHRETGTKLANAGLTTLLAVGKLAIPLADGFSEAGGNGQWFGSVAEAAQWLIGAAEPGDRLLIKGSRSAAMEAILPILAAGF